MLPINVKKVRIAITTLLAIGLMLTFLPGPVYSQEGDSPTKVQDLIVNGGFEGGFQQDFGVGYSWGGFSNGNAVVGWNFDDWDPLVASGDYAQRIEISDVLEQDRYAGIYQTVRVVPGQQYKLTIKGLVRSDEGDVKVSDYGYRLQYAIDYEGDTAWELVSSSAWQELPWDEQPMELAEGSTYDLGSYDTTITAKTNQLTIFIRGWKKWLDNGSGIFDVDDISFVGPAPAGFQSPVAAASAAGSTGEQPAAEIISAESAEAEVMASEEVIANEEVATQDSAAEFAVPAPQTEESELVEDTTSQVMAETEEALQTEAAPQDTIEQTQGSPSLSISAPNRPAPLPVSGQGSDNVFNYVLFFGAALLLVLVSSAVAATIKQRGVME